MRKPLFLALASTVILASFAIRLWHIETEPIWHDEGWSIRAIQAPFDTPDDNTPPVYYVSSHLLWRLGSGDSTLAFRYSSVLFGVITVALALYIGKRWFGHIAGLAVGVLVTSSPLLWDYSQEVRAYVIVPIIALILLYCALEILQRRKSEPISPKLWGLVFVTQIIGLYTHNLTVPLIVWLNVALGVLWLIRYDLRKMVIWSGIEITLILIYLPWLNTQSPSGTPLNSPPEIGFGLVRDIWYAYFLPVIQHLQAVESPTLIHIFGGITIGTMIVLIGRLLYLNFPPQFPAMSAKRDSLKSSSTATYNMKVQVPSLRGRGDLGVRTESLITWILTTHVILVPIFSTVLILAAHIDFHPRYYVASVGGTMLLIVGGVIQLSTWLPKQVMLIGLSLIVLLGIGISADSLHTMTTTRAYQHDDFAGLAEYYATLPDDTVIIVPFDREPALEVYYAERLDIQAQFVKIPLYSDEATAIEALNQLYADGVRQVEFLTWFQLPADVRGMYPCILNAISSDIGEPRFYFGLQTQAYTLSAPITWQPLDLNPTYQQVTLRQADYIAESPYGACVRTTWTLNQPTNDIINVAGAILNPLGDEIARADTVIADNENVTTQEWSDGNMGSAYTWIPLSDGAPRTTYGLALNLYTEQVASGFDVFDETGNPIGVTLITPNAITAQGYPITDSSDSVQIIATDGINADNIFETGRAITFTLILPPSESRTQELILRGDNWELSQPVNANTEGSVLAWGEFTVPPSNHGTAELLLDDVLLATYTLIDRPREFAAPDVDIEVDIPFVKVGSLYGVDLPENVSPDAPAEVTLIWQADETSEITYTVFVQLLADDGRVLAQSDAQPAQGERPTTGWIAGEYITDTHTLQWHITDYQGDARLIAGFYDAENGFQRITLAGSEADFVTIDAEIAVTGN